MTSIGINMKRFSVIVLLFFSVGLARAQNVSGVITDSLGTSLPSATVVLLAPVDSSLVKFAIANNDGEFIIRRVESGKYILQVTFVGYDTKLQDITVGEGDLDVGTVALSERTSELDALVISADRIPIQVSGDTLQYNAAAFGVRANAAVEELLRRLPGVEVAEDGSITAGGETVQNVLVDGKEFFGTDHRMATQNLPAAAVENVQVYDKQSDKAEFTGVDDGEREKTINLELKEDAKQGYFGDITGGYGNVERYEGRASINRFSPTTQLSFIGNVNNVNAGGGFSQEVMMMGGGMFVSRGDGGGSSSSGGFSENMSGGLNLGHNFSGKTDIRGSYNINYRDSWQDRTVRQQQLLGSNLSGNVFELGKQQNTSLRHNVDMNLRHEFAEGHDVRLRVTGSISGSDAFNFRDRDTFNPEGEHENESKTTNDTESDQISGNAQLFWRKRLNEKGLALIAEGRADLNDSESSTLLNSSDILYGDVITENELAQLQESMTNRLTQTQRLTISQPIGLDKMIEVRGEHRLVSEDQDRPVYDRVAGNLELNTALSSGFDRSYRYVEGGVHYRQGSDLLTLGVGVDIQKSDLSGDLFSGVEINNGYTHLMPTANVRYQVQQGMYLNLRYNTSTREPSLTELQPFTDNSDPLNVYTGNPDLEPQYSHNVNLFFTWFDQFTFTNLFAYVNTSYTKNSIVRSRTVDPGTFRQESTSVNADGDWTVNANVNFGRPINRIRAKYSLSTSAMFSRGVEFINTEENETNTMRNTISATLENRTKDLFDIRATARYSFNRNEYSLNPQLDRSYLNRTFSGSGTLFLGDNWEFATSLDYQLYSEEVFGDANSVPLWQASISRFFMDRRAEVQFTGLDLLNNDVGINYTNTSTYIQEEQIGSLGQYFMLKFTWRLSPLGGSGGGRGIRIMRD